VFLIIAHKGNWDGPERLSIEVAMNTRFLTENEVAQRTHISLGTLRRWRLENRGPRFHKFGSLVRYAEEDLAVWQDAQPHGGDIPSRIGPASESHTSQLRKSG
jgi:excisionase family DNA binding protein